MGKIIKTKYEIYKMFELDIWGHIFLFDKRLVNSKFWKKIGFLLNFIVLSSNFRSFFKKRLYIYI